MPLHLVKPNPLLSQVMRIIRAGAPPVPAGQRFSVRLDHACGDAFAQVWFLTRGCAWDRAGTCTMCNYGHGPDVTEDAMVEAVTDALESIQGPVDEIFVSPSGSMLDPAEVPARARQRILEVLASFRAPKVCVETRAETVTPETADCLAAALPAKRVTVEMGLESSSSWVRQFCINRACGPAAFPEAAAVLRTRGIRVSANVSLGSAFLSPAEAIEDARRSIGWALRHGADLAVVFPLHVKPHTLLAWLHERKLYNPPSLWSLVEVLSKVEAQDLSRVTISWYRSDYGSVEKSLGLPTTCPRCRQHVLGLLDRFRDRPSPENLAALDSEECECRAIWREEIARAPGKPLAERVLEHYDLLAEEFGLSESWASRRRGLRAELLSSSS